MTSSSTAGLGVPALLVNTVEGAVQLARGVGLGGVTPAGQVVLGYVLSGGALVLGNLPRLIRVVSRRARGQDGVDLLPFSKSQGRLCAAPARQPRPTSAPAPTVGVRVR